MVGVCAGGGVGALSSDLGYGYWLLRSSLGATCIPRVMRAAFEAGLEVP